MDKKAAIVAGFILIVISSALAYALLNKPAEPKQEEVATVPDAPVQQPNPSSPPTPGIYAAYSSEAVASAKGDILLFFHAPWCPQCRELEKSIQSSVLPENLTVLKVDYDTNQPLRQRYGVTIQTTVIKIDTNGDKLKTYVAYDEPTFGAVKRELL